MSQNSVQCIPVQNEPSHANTFINVEGTNQNRGGGTDSADFEFMFNTAVELDLSVEHVLPTLLSIVFKLFTTFKLIGCRSNFATDSCPENI
jgi:hypothetical protein